jgi:hypothetical protein
MDMNLATLAKFPAEENWVDKSQHGQGGLLAAKPVVAAINQRVRCHNCGQVGHKSTYCQEEPIDADELNQLLMQD